MCNTGTRLLHVPDFLFYPMLSLVLRLSAVPSAWPAFLRSTTSSAKKHPDSGKHYPPIEYLCTFEKLPNYKSFALEWILLYFL